MLRGQLLTPAEVALRLGLSRGTIYNWIYERRLPAVRLSRRAVRVREEVVTALVRRAEAKQ